MNLDVVRSLKAKYWGNFIQNLIRAVDAKRGLPRTLISDEMQLLRSFWSEGSDKTVNNSFRNVVMYEEVTEDPIDDQDDLF